MGATWSQAVSVFSALLAQAVTAGRYRGESIADHSFRMAMMSMIAPSLNLDQNRCVKMCLVHDLGETLVGDITPADGVPKAEKERREKLAINHITELLKPLSIVVAKEIQELWDEFEHCETPESQFVQDIDKLELLSQMIEYEKRGKINLQEFTYVKTKIRLPDTKRWAEQLLDEREKFWAGKEVPIGIGTGEDTKSEQDQYYSNK